MPDTRKASEGGKLTALVRKIRFRRWSGLETLLFTSVPAIRKNILGAGGKEAKIQTAETR